MTQDKDLKRLIRERMVKTGESYTAAKRHFGAPAVKPHASDDEVEHVDSELGVEYRREPDGSWSARDLKGRRLVGYGPEQYPALLDLRAQMPPFFGRILGRAPGPIIMKLAQYAHGGWSGRTSLDLGASVTAESEDEVRRQLVRRFGPVALGPVRRTVRFKEHADGRWSAQGDRWGGAIGWGATQLEAEKYLVWNEDEFDVIYDDPGPGNEHSDDY